VADLRQQIISNALVIFPHIVDKHTKKYPNTPVHAEDIFDTCIILGSWEHPNRALPGPYFAQLRYADGKAPAIRKLLLRTAACDTAEEALRNLFESTAAQLGFHNDLLISRRDGLVLVPDVCSNSPTECHTDNIYEAKVFVENYVSEAQSTGSATSPETLAEVQKNRGMKWPKALSKKCKKVMRGMARK
jgi:hypothetical protein